MVRTVIIGSCVSVQGTFVKTLKNGKTVVRVGDRYYTGVAVAHAA